MYLAGIEDTEWINDRYEFWNDVYGFQMSSMKEFLSKDAVVDCVDKNVVVTSTATLVVCLCLVSSWFYAAGGGALGVLIYPSFHPTICLSICSSLFLAVLVRSPTPPPLLHPTPFTVLPLE